MISTPTVISPVNAGALVATSVVLQRLHDEVPAGHFTLRWLMAACVDAPSALSMILLAVVAMAPGIAIVAGLLLIFPAFEMMTGQPAPRFPGRIADQPLPTRHLAALVQRAVPVLLRLQKMIHPPCSGTSSPCPSTW